MKERLFVYGTLKKDIRAAEIIGEERLHFIGKGRIDGTLYDLGDYPAVVPTKGKFVYGEVYEISDPECVLQKLDTYEGIDPVKPEKSLFVRREAKVLIEAEQEFWHMYIFIIDPRMALKLLKAENGKSQGKQAEFRISL